MKPLYLFILTALLPFAALAQDPYAPVSAAGIILDDLKFVKRPLVVFADSPDDPSFLRQMQLLALGYPALVERDVIVVTDTDPGARSDLRQKLRPQGFSLVILDKDLKPAIRKPLPWDVREITQAIDKFPLRRIEMQEASPAGR